MISSSVTPILSNVIYTIGINLSRYKFNAVSIQSSREKKIFLLSIRLRNKLHFIVVCPGFTLEKTQFSPIFLFLSILLSSRTNPHLFQRSIDVVVPLVKK